MATRSMKVLKELADKAFETEKKPKKSKKTKKPNPRRATNRELAKWLAQGNGETTNEGCSGIFSLNGYEAKYENTEVSDVVKVRKWEDTDWHEPTVDYMEIK